MKISCTILVLLGWLPSTQAQSEAGSLRKLDDVIDGAATEFHDESNHAQSKAESLRKLYSISHYEFVKSTCATYDKLSERPRKSPCDLPVTATPEWAVAECDKDEDCIWDPRQSRCLLYEWVKDDEKELAEIDCAKHERAECDEDEDCIWDPRHLPEPPDPDPDGPKPFQSPVGFVHELGTVPRCLLYESVQNDKKELEEIACAHHGYSWQKPRPSIDGDGEHPSIDGDGACEADPKCIWHHRRHVCLREESYKSEEDRRDLFCALHNLNEDECRKHENQCYNPYPGHNLREGRLCCPRLMDDPKGCYTFDKEVYCKSLGDGCLWIPESFYDDLPLKMWDDCRSQCVNPATFFSNDCKSKEDRFNCELSSYVRDPRYWTCRWTDDDAGGRCDPVYRHCELYSNEECQNDKLCVKTLTDSCVSVAEASASELEFSGYCRDRKHGDDTPCCPNNKPKKCGARRFNANLKCGYDRQILINEFTGQQECLPTSRYECKKSGDSDYSWEKTWTNPSNASLGECDASWVAPTENPTMGPSQSMSPTRTMSPSQSMSPTPSDCSHHCTEQFWNWLKTVTADTDSCSGSQTYTDDDGCGCNERIQKALEKAGKEIEYENKPNKQAQSWLALLFDQLQSGNKLNAYWYKAMLAVSLSAFTPTGTITIDWGENYGVAGYINELNTQIKYWKTPATENPTVSPSMSPNQSNTPTRSISPTPLDCPGHCAKQFQNWLDDCGGDQTYTDNNGCGCDERIQKALKKAGEEIESENKPDKQAQSWVTLLADQVESGNINVTWYKAVLVTCLYLFQYADPVTRKYLPVDLDPQNGGAQNLKFEYFSVYGLRMELDSQINIMWTRPKNFFYTDELIEQMEREKQATSSITILGKLLKSDGFAFSEQALIAMVPEAIVWESPTYTFKNEQTIEAYRSFWEDAGRGWINTERYLFNTLRSYLRNQGYEVSDATYDSLLPPGIWFLVSTNPDEEIILDEPDCEAMDDSGMTDGHPEAWATCIKNQLYLSTGEMRDIEDIKSTLLEGYGLESLSIKALREKFESKTGSQTSDIFSDWNLLLLAFREVDDFS